MDILIPVGGPQNNDYRELRYTLRALDKHMTDIGRLFIAGHVPVWLINVTQVPWTTLSKSPVVDVQDKLLTFCDIEEATEDFLFCHDDILANADFSGAELPFYALQEGVGSFNNPLYFQVHTPIRYNREMYKALFSNPDSNKVPSPRAYYCNMYNAPATKTVDTVLRVGAGMKPYKEQIEGVPFYSLNDRAAGKPEFLAMMEELLPIPSRWESPDDFELKTTIAPDDLM